MDAVSRIETGDRSLIQIVDAALAEAVRKAGPWLVCRPGCTECCMGPFPISQLDAHRLRRGLAELEASEPERVARVRERARQAVARMLPDFPGDAGTGVLDEERFAQFDDDAPCPALDPSAGTCDLYTVRPMTCRTFGPPVRCGSGEEVGICELCFNGATDADIARCEVEPDPDGMESTLIDDLENSMGTRGQTIVAFALAS